MNRDIKVLEAVTIGIDILSAYVLLRRIVARVQVYRAPTPSSAIG